MSSSHAHTTANKKKESSSCDPGRTVQRVETRFGSAAVSTFKNMSDKGEQTEDSLSPSPPQDVKAEGEHPFKLIPQGVPEPLTPHQDISKTLPPQHQDASQVQTSRQHYDPQVSSSKHKDAPIVSTTQSQPVPMHQKTQQQQQQDIGEPVSSLSGQDVPKPQEASKVVKACQTSAVTDKQPEPQKASKTDKYCQTNASKYLLHQQKDGT
ncbi:hypothetical protein Pcinc_005378 [Petrolisthes cinctipes]|uniref:Uncharacterized protein n=1 Tax=Petrolisthes cinctipes TaxID=88211 RepID=A0AAE1GCU1_PETCI|nr:hypothetical protein Pcinc_005378 [Petrolisthes cinctipes]